MSTKKILIAGITALGLLGSLASYAEDEKRSFGEYADDKIILDVAKVVKGVKSVQNNLSVKGK